MSLKQGLLKKIMSMPVYYDESKDLPLEFRSLIDFIRGGCEELERRAKEKLMRNSEAFLTVVNAQLHMAETKIRHNHRSDLSETRWDKKVRDWSYYQCRIKKGCSCINGFRDLVPDYFPDPDNFKIIRDQMALVCKCEQCLEDQRS